MIELSTADLVGKPLTIRRLLLEIGMLIIVPVVISYMVID